MRVSAMKDKAAGRQLGCVACANGETLGFEISMAFQPIVDRSTKTVFAQEALVRGLNNEPAGKIFELVNDDNLYRFDQTCRVKAIELAASLGIDTYVSINFMPNAVYRPELCIRTTLAAAEHYGFPLDRIILEITEGEKVVDHQHLVNIVEEYKARGFKVALDDFGAGYAGLNLLADFQPDFIKLDMALVRNIDQDKVRQAIVRGMLEVCRELEIVVIAEGVETESELLCLESFGIELFQGYYFAKPSFQSLAKDLKI